MSNSPVLGLTLMSASQAQKETVFNEFLIAMDSLFRGSVLSASLNTPPASPNPGDAYIVAPGGTGLWSGQDNNVAYYFNGWQFVIPPLKLRLYDVATSLFMTFQGGTTNWTVDPVSTVSVLDDLTNVTGAPTDGQVLTWFNAAGKWEPKTPAFTGPLSGLSDVNVAEGAGINGWALAWNQATGKWTPQQFITAIPAVDFLGLPDVVSTDAQNGWVLVYDAAGPKAQFVPITTLTTVPSLGNVGDVAYPTGGASAIPAGAGLLWNGAAWAPSTAVMAYKVVGIQDGPGSYVGKAGDLIRVNAVETGWEYVSPAAALGSSFSLADLNDVTVAEGAAINGYALTWNNAAAKWEPTLIATGATALSGLSDVAVTEGSAINGDVLAWNESTTKWQPIGLSLVAFSGHYADLSGAPALATVATSGEYSDLAGAPVIPSNSSFSLAGLADVNITEGLAISGYVLTWNEAAQKWQAAAPASAGATALSSLTDVSIPTEGSGIDGYALVWNNTAGKWEPAQLAAVAKSGAFSDLTGAPAIPTNASFSLSGLGDVSVSEGSAINGYLLSWSNSAGKWVPVAPTAAGATALAALTDVAESSPTNNQQLVYSGSAGKWENVSQPVGISVSITGLMQNGEILLQYLPPVALQIPAGASGSFAKAASAATAATTVKIMQNGTQIGTIAWAASATVGVITISNNVNLAAGDSLQLIAPATADTTLANIGVTLSATRS